MKRLKIIVACLIIFLSLQTKTVSAQENKFGIHIIDESDLERAAELVNSNGGEWGYVTFVVREDQMDIHYLQRVFDKMRQLKLIPIVRVATKMQGGAWVKPNPEIADAWSSLFDKLLWPTNDRYIIVYNEPNHAKEWGGDINPKEYAQVLDGFYEAFADAAKEYVLLPAAMDLAAPNSQTTQDAKDYWIKAWEHDNGIFQKIDAWNSHSYPNPAFSGSYKDLGKSSVRGFLWELETFSEFGLEPEIDVFITETGWIANSPAEYENIAKNYKAAFEEVWSDTQVKAVTPFLLSYKSPPFDKFSFLDKNGNPLPQFNTLKSMPKKKGEPNQLHGFEYLGSNLPKEIVTESNYIFYVKLKNVGQSIWSSKDGFSLEYSLEAGEKEKNSVDLPYTQPGQTVSIPLRLATDDEGMSVLKFWLKKDEEKITEEIDHKLEILAPPSLEIRAGSFLGQDKESEYTLSIYKEKRQILKIDELLVIDGQASLKRIHNIVPGEVYSVKINKKNHLPKTKEIVFSKGNNFVNFQKLFPFDFNNDDRLGFADILFYVSKTVKNHGLAKSQNSSVFDKSASLLSFFR